MNPKKIIHAKIIMSSTHRNASESTCDEEGIYICKSVGSSD